LYFTKTINIFCSNLAEFLANLITGCQALRIYVTIDVYNHQLLFRFNMLKFE
jgi:hypothetical protein